jgi:ArsR family transcriptional regulator
MEDSVSARTSDTRTELTPVACCTPVSAPEIDRDQARSLASVFKALSDPSRVRIVNLLANAGEPICVCELMPQLDLSQATVSFHLRKLRDAGLLDRQQRGTWAYYSLTDDALQRLRSVFDSKEVTH